MSRADLPNAWEQHAARVPLQLARNRRPQEGDSNETARMPVRKRVFFRSLVKRTERALKRL
jgi:hypothetical protein